MKWEHCGILKGSNFETLVPVTSRSGVGAQIESLLLPRNYLTEQKIRMFERWALYFMIR